MGWMSGNGTEFLPGNTVLFEEAVKVMVSAAGYQIYAAGKGGYPTGYMAVSYTQLDVYKRQSWG